MDKSVTKNVAIIFLVIFLAFSVIVNIFFVMRAQSLNQQDNFLFIGKSHFNQSQPDFSFKPFNGTTLPVQNCSAIVHIDSGFYSAGIQSGE